LAWFFVGSLLTLVVALIPSLRFDAAYYFGRFVCPVALRILGIRLEIRRQERLETSRPCVFIPNHQHLLDVFVLGALLPRKTISVGKQSLRWIPVFGWLYKRCGHLFIDRGDNAEAVKVMQKAQRLIVERGQSVIIAPEGTRSQGRGLLPFKRGAFHLAIGTGMPLQPIAISSFNKFIDFSRWRAGTVLVELLEPIPVQGVSKDQIDDLIARAHSALGSAIKTLDSELSQPDDVGRISA
jgi:1-acyl-sn-glycerol-3-phosphate acyltransferase